MTFSGDGEFDLASTVQAFHIEETTYFNNMTKILNQSESNTLLLHVILAVCIAILILFLCILICYCRQICRKKSRRKSRVIKTKTVLLSKATSISGLNGNYNQCNNDNLKEAQFSHNMQVQLEEYKSPCGKKQNTLLEPNVGNIPPGFNNKSYLQMKLVTSTPTVKNAAILQSGVSGVMIFSPQSTIAGNDWQSARHDVTTTPSYALQYSSPCIANQTKHLNLENCASPASTQSSETEKDVVYSKSRDSISSACLYGTAASQLFEADQKNCSSKEDDSDKYTESEELLPDTVLPELSPLSPEGVTSSLPLDAYGHPRAWFVPLDEIYHEPLRHSFIDVSNSSQEHEFLVQQKKNSNKATTTFSSKNNCSVVNSVHSPSSNSTGESDALYEKNDDGSLRWRDSGVPSSQILTKSSSSDLEGKKLPSAWDQREARPVIFFEKEISEEGPIFDSNAYIGT